LDLLDRGNGCCLLYTSHAERHSRSITYRADVAVIRRLAAFLVEDCCGGVPEACEPVMSGRASFQSKMAADV